MKKCIDQRELERCGTYLDQHNLKLVCAESMTAGFLSSMWALELSSGAYYLGSIVCYDDQQKQTMLRVPKELIEIHTAESAEVTLSMIDGLKAHVPTANVYISITGLAFESKNSKQYRPVGRVYYAFSYRKYTSVFEKQFTGTTSDIIISTCNAIFFDLIRWLEGVIDAHHNKLECASN